MIVQLQAYKKIPSQIYQILLTIPIEVLVNTEWKCTKCIKYTFVLYVK